MRKYLPNKYQLSVLPMFLGCLAILVLIVTECHKSAFADARFDPYLRHLADQYIIPDPDDSTAVTIFGSRQKLNINGQEVMVSIASDYVFADTTARDSYFTSNPTELTDGRRVLITGTGDLQEYDLDTTTWITISAIARGPAGADGADGDDGAAGADGADGDSAYVYIAYASDDSGTDFTTTFSSALDYIAVLTTDTEIPSPAVGDFTGLWKNYKGATGDTGAAGADGDDGADGANGIVSAWALSQSYVQDDIVANDGVLYGCSTGHTSSADDEPGVGVSWETYWELVGYTANPEFESVTMSSADQDPDAPGKIVYDNTVTNHANGALRWQDDNGDIRQIIDMIAATAQGCTDDQVVAYDADNDLFYCKADATGVGGDQLVDIVATAPLLVNGGANVDNALPGADADITFSLNFGITDDYAVQMDDADAADNDFAKFTAAGLEGRSYAEVRQDLGIDSIANLATTLSFGAFAPTLLGYADGAAVLAGIGAQAAVTEGSLSDDVIVEADLKSTNAPTDNYILSYDLASGGFTWVTNGAGATELDGLTDIDAEGTANYVLTDDGDGTYTFKLLGTANMDFSANVDTLLANASYADFLTDLFSGGYTAGAVALNLSAATVTLPAAIDFPANSVLPADLDQDGNYTSLTGNWTTTGTITGGNLLTAGTVGGAASEIADLYLADGGVIYLGNDQDITITHVADAGLLVNGYLRSVQGWGADITGNIALNTTALHGVWYQVTAACTITLDAAADAGYGSEVAFRVRDVSETVIIEIDAANKINLYGTPLDAGDTIDSPGVAGDFIVLKATTDADGTGTDGWVTLGSGGTWTDGGAT